MAKVAILSTGTSIGTYSNTGVDNWDISALMALINTRSSPPITTLFMNTIRYIYFSLERLL
jgi:hypothetical protein